MCRAKMQNAANSFAQSYEVFFSLFLRAELVFKPFVADPMFKLHDVNLLLEELRRNIKGYAFDDLRALFLDYIISGCSPNTLAAAKRIVSKLSNKPRTPKTEAINRLFDSELVRLLTLLKDSNINSLRNRIVHKDAYRPNRQEAEAALKQARDILFPLTGYFNIYDDINWYLARP
jgi:hypothetical protein